MKVSFCKFNGIALLLILSCIFFVTPKVVAAKPLSDGEARRIVEEGINRFRYVVVPIGFIKTHMVSTVEDYKKREFSLKTLKRLTNLKNMGILTLNDVQLKNTTGNPFDTYGWAGHNVSITEKGKKMKFNVNDTGDYIYKLGTANIVKIVKNAVSEGAKLRNPGQDMRIVMGIYQFSPTEFGKEWYSMMGEKLENTYKFRALLKYDDFKEIYEYVGSDYGLISKNTWETNRIEGY